MNVSGRDQRPRDQRACLNSCGVKNKRPKQIRAYAVIVGTAAALTRDVKATGDGRMVHRSSAETISMTVTALRGSLLDETWEIQPENGSTPSRATAHIRRELATPATVVFWTHASTDVFNCETRTSTNQHKSKYTDNVHEDMTTLTQRQCVQRDKRLRGAKSV